jgi:hypothetical protein
MKGNKAGTMRATLMYADILALATAKAEEAELAG